MEVNKSMPNDKTNNEQRETKTPQRDQNTGQDPKKTVPPKRQETGPNDPKQRGTE